MLEEHSTPCLTWWRNRDGLGVLCCWCWKMCSGWKETRKKVKNEACHSILQCRAILCEWHLIWARVILQQDNDPEDYSKITKETVSWNSVYEWLASAVTRSQPYWAGVGPAGPNEKKNCLLMHSIQLVGGASGWNVYRVPE